MADLETLEYEGFEYKHFDEPALSLEEAVKKASQLRSSDTQNFYRIKPVDSKGLMFRVESRSKQRVYAERVNRWRGLLNQFATRLSER